MELQHCLGASFEQVDEEDIAQVTEPAPGCMRLRTVHATVWRRLASPEISAADDQPAQVARWDGRKTLFIATRSLSETPYQGH